MDGPTLAKICNLECQKRGISKAQFYKDIGVSAPSFHGWVNGAKPSEKYITAIEKYFEIDLKSYEKSDETDELREMLRDRQDLRILLHSAKDVPASSIYALISQIEKMKEDEKQVDSAD